MIKNSDFELDWSEEKSHKALVLPVGGDAYEKDIENIFCPPYWTVWFRHQPDTWDQPEVRDARKNNDETRVYRGEKAMLMFSFYRHHDGGYFQTVDVALGSRIRLSAMAHAWSNVQDSPHTDEPNWSEGAGYEPGFMLEGTAPDDNWRNATFYVGIDPTGGTNPLSNTVVWGTGAHIYNAYREIPPVEVTAVSNKVTVFIRSIFLHPFKHDDFYLDTVKFEILEEPIKDRGDPRVQYKREYVLLPPGSDDAWAHAVITGSWNKSRFTVGASADDAGIGNLDNRHVIAVNPDWWADDLEAFFKQYYEGVVYSTVTADTPEELTLLLAGDTPPNKWEKYALNQRHPEWSTAHFGSGTCMETIGSAGCYITNLAMAEMIYELDSDTTPGSVDAKLTPAGYDGCLALWDAVKSNLKIKISGANTDEGKKHLLDGKIAMIRVLPENPMHFVLAVEYTGDDYLILDPLYGEVALLSKRYAGVYGWRLLDKASTVPNVPHNNNLISLHIQSNVPGIWNYVSKSKPSVIKLVSGMETAIKIKELSPNTLIVYRHHVDEQPMEGDPRVLMQNYLNKFKDSLKSLEGYIWGTEGYNETTPSKNAEVVARSAELDAAFAEVLADSGIDVKPVLLNIAVGNPFQSELPLLLPAVDAAVKYGGALGYHAYWWGNRNVSGLDSWWKWHAGRWIEQDKYFNTQGYYPKWMFGECGVVGSENGQHLLPSSGWKNEDCLNGNWTRYREEIRRFRDYTLEWNLTHQNRVLGFTIFTTGSHFTGWNSFQIQEAEMNSLLEL